MINLLSGIIVVNKPLNYTSHDVVNFIRKKFKIKKVGHCGTLDPLATGVLVILLGNCTKISNSIIGRDKIYDVTMTCGIKTDSMDISGKILYCNNFFNENMINDVIYSFIGEYMQTPPMFSAKKINGIRLYKLARNGINVYRKPSSVKIKKISIKYINLPYVRFTITCSSGTYIRTLCDDIGNKLKIGCTLLSLNRLFINPCFSLKRSFDLDYLKSINLEKFKNIINDTLYEFKYNINNIIQK